MDTIKGIVNKVASRKLSVTAVAGTAAVTFLLAVLTFPFGVFLRRTSYHGFRKAFKDLLSRGDSV